MGKGTKPTKTEVARMMVLSELGYTPFAISKLMNRSNHTVKKYTDAEEYRNDREVHRMVREIIEKEHAELTILGAKARARLSELLDEGKTKPRETGFIMDKCFTERRLLEGQSTVNVSYNEIEQSIEELVRERKTLESELGIDGE